MTYIAPGIQLCDLPRGFRNCKRGVLLKGRSGKRVFIETIKRTGQVTGFTLKLRGYECLIYGFVTRNPWTFWFIPARWVLMLVNAGNERMGWGLEKPRIRRVPKERVGLAGVTARELFSAKDPDWLLIRDALRGRRKA